MGAVATSAMADAGDIKIVGQDDIDENMDRKTFDEYMSGRKLSSMKNDIRVDKNIKRDNVERADITHEKQETIPTMIPDPILKNKAMISPNQNPELLAFEMKDPDFDSGMEKTIDQDEMKNENQF